MKISKILLTLLILSTYLNADIEINDPSMYSPVTDTVMTFTVTIDGNLSTDIHYKTEDVTAFAGTDYVAIEGTIEVPSTDIPTTVDINVTIKALSSGYFNLVLNNLDGARINDGIGQGSIIDTFALCYRDSTGDNIASNKCLLAGDFYHAKDNNHNCQAEVTLVNRDLDDTLSNLTVYKLYDDNATNGSCSGACTGSPTPISTTDTDIAYDNFGSGYTYNIGSLSAGTNITLIDNNTYNSATAITDIMLFADYTSKGLNYKRKVFSCSGGAVNITTTGSADIVNDWVDDATYNGGTHYIKTKIAQESNTQNTVITAVHLDKDTHQATLFSPTDATQVYNIIPYLADESCTVLENIEDPATPGVPLVLEVQAGTSNASGNMLVSNTSAKERYMKMIIIDSTSLSDEGQNCILKSSTSGNFARIAQCANSEVQYLDAFGTDAWARCGNNNGEPCLSSNHGVADPTSPTYNPLYDNELGCYMCTFDIQPACTTDNFAIRPEKFVLASTNPHMPNLLRSGSDYNMSINAYDYSTTTNSVGYTQSDTNLTVATTKWDNNSPKVIDATLNGTVTSGDFNITNGISTYNGTSGEVASISYTDVGFITASVQDRNWAAIDMNDIKGVGDITLPDCSSNGGYICGDKNVTFIPHHFSITDINMSNNNGLPGTYTYIANLDDANQSTFNMAARIQATIMSKNEANVTTTNFQTGSAYYENPVSVRSDITNTLHGDANTTTIPAVLLGFISGETQITWDESNLSQVLRFNFPRDVNNSINPFLVYPSDMNISAKSIYTQTAVTGFDSLAIIPDANESNGLGDGNATMIYGRTNGPRQSFTINPGTAFIYYEAYCSATDTEGVPCTKALLPNGVDSTFTNDPRWFKNTLHTAINGGTVGTITQKGAASVVTNAPGVIEATGQATASLTYTGSSYPYKTTMENNASTWLIYNKYDINATTNEFEVEFLGETGKWAGKDDANSTANTTGALKTNRRSMW